MDWIMEPVAAFKLFEPIAADSCTGEGTKLNSCTTPGSLVVCECSRGLIVPKVN